MLPFAIVLARQLVGLRAFIETYHQDVVFSFVEGAASTYKEFKGSSTLANTEAERDMAWRCCFAVTGGAIHFTIRMAQPS